MKKSLVALAVLAATGAFAQSSVTLYGRLDLGTSGGKVETTTPGLFGNVTSTVKKTSLAGEQSAWTGSRLGVRGSEDLGGGLKANFNVETRIDPDATGSGQSTFGRTRNAFLQVAGGFGSVTIGTYLNPFDDIRYAVGTPGIAGGTLLENLLGGNLGANPATPAGAAFVANGFSNPAGGLSGRSQNSIGYRSPVFGGGFTASIGTGYEKVDTNGTVGQGSGYIASIGYANGPINVLAAYGSQSLKGSTPTVTTLATKNTDFGIKASYDLGVAIPFVMFERTKSNALGTVNDNKGRGIEAGASFPMGAFTPYVSFGQVKTTVATVNAKTNGFQIGTKYDLSKRTFVYGGFGNEKTNNSTAAGAVINSTKSNGYALGLVHNF